MVFKMADAEEKSKTLESNDLINDSGHSGEKNGYCSKSDEPNSQFPDKSDSFQEENIENGHSQEINDASDLATGADQVTEMSKEENPSVSEDATKLEPSDQSEKSEDKMIVTTGEADTTMTVVTSETVTMVTADTVMSADETESQQRGIEQPVSQEGSSIMVTDSETAVKNGNIENGEEQISDNVDKDEAMKIPETKPSDAVEVSVSMEENGVIPERSEDQDGEERDEHREQDVSSVSPTVTHAGVPDENDSIDHNENYKQQEEHVLSQSLEEVKLTDLNQDPVNREGSLCAIEQVRNADTEPVVDFSSVTSCSDGRGSESDKNQDIEDTLKIDAVSTECVNGDEGSVKPVEQGSGDNGQDTDQADAVCESQEPASSQNADIDSKTATDIEDYTMETATQRSVDEGDEVVTTPPKDSKPCGGDIPNSPYVVDVTSEEKVEAQDCSSSLIIADAIDTIQIENLESSMDDQIRIVDVPGGKERKVEIVTTESNVEQIIHVEDQIQSSPDVKGEVNVLQDVSSKANMDEQKREDFITERKMEASDHGDGKSAEDSVGILVAEVGTDVQDADVEVVLINSEKSVSTTAQLQAEDKNKSDEATVGLSCQLDEDKTRDLSLVEEVSLVHDSILTKDTTEMSVNSVSQQSKQMSKDSYSKQKGQSDFFQIVGVAATLHEDKDKQKTSPLTNIQVIDANDLVFSDDDFERPELSGSYGSQDDDDVLTNNKFQDNEKRESLKITSVEDVLSEPENDIESDNASHPDKLQMDNKSSSKSCDLKREENLLEYIDSKYDFKSRKEADKGDPTTHYQLQDDKQDKKVDKNTELDSDSEFLLESGATQDEGKEKAETDISANRNLDEKEDFKQKWNESVLDSPRSDKEEDIPFQTRQRLLFSGNEKEDVDNEEFISRSYEERTQKIIASSVALRKKILEENSLIVSKTDSDLAKKFNQNIPHVPCEHGEMEHEMPSYSEMFTATEVEPNTDVYKTNTPGRYGRSAYSKENTSYTRRSEDSEKLPLDKFSASFSQVEDHITGTRAYSPIHNGRSREASSRMAAQFPSQSVSDKYYQSPRAAHSMNLTSPTLSRTPRARGTSQPFELTSPLLHKTPSKEDPSSRLLAELEERHLQAMEDVQNQISSQSSSPLTNAEFASHVRCNLREKHSRHLADLRAFYEDEVASLKRQMTSAAYVMSQPQYQELQDQYEQTRSKCTYLEGELNTANKIIKERENQVRSLQIRLKEWPERYETAQSAQKNLQHQLDQLRAYSSDQESHIQSLESTVQQLTSTIQEAQRLQRDDADKMRQEQSVTQKLQAEVSALQHSNQVLQSNLFDTDNKLQESRSQTSDLKRTVMRLELEVTRLARENDLLHHRSLNSLRGTSLDHSGLADLLNSQTVRSSQSSPLVSQYAAEKEVTSPHTQSSANVVPSSPARTLPAKDASQYPPSREIPKVPDHETFRSQSHQEQRKTISSPIRSPVKVTDTLTSRAVSANAVTPSKSRTYEDGKIARGQKYVREKSPVRLSSESAISDLKKADVRSSPSKSQYSVKSAGSKPASGTGVSHQDKEVSGIYTIRASSGSTATQPQRGHFTEMSSKPKAACSLSRSSENLQAKNNDSSHGTFQMQKHQNSTYDTRPNVNSKSYSRSSDRTGSQLTKASWDPKNDSNKSSNRSKTLSERGRPKGPVNSAPGIQSHQKAVTGQVTGAKPDNKSFGDQNVAMDISVQTAIDRVKAGVYITQPMTSASEPKRRGALTKPKAEERIRDISRLENSMEALSMEKRKLESALSRIPTSHSTGRVSRQASQQKEIVEDQLDAVDKQLGQIRMALRKYHAL